MKSYVKVATPDRIPQNLSPGRVAEETNKRLADLARQVNQAFDSLTGKLVDMGLWSQGEIVEVVFDWTLNREQAEDVDVPVNHRLGIVPRYWIIVGSESGRFRDTAGTPIEVGGTMWRAPTAWTAQTVVFRAESNAWYASMKFTVLLVP